MATFTMNTRNRCTCSDNCPGTTKRYFAQGHDARLVSRLRDEVLANKATLASALKELAFRNGTQRLADKLTNTVTNAQTKPARKAKVAKATQAKEQTIEVDGHRLVASARASEPNVTRKVGRWTYDGQITEHRVVGGDKSDTVRVFRYVDRKGVRQVTTRHFAA